MFRWDLILRGTATCALLAILAVKIHWLEVLAIFSQADVKILFLVALFSPIVVLGLVGRLFWLLRRRGFDVPFLTAWRATWSGQFFNLCLPGSTGGDIVRVLELSGGKRELMGRLTGVILIDRVFALLALVIMASCAVVWGGFPLKEWLPKLDLKKIVFLGMIGLVVMGGGWWALRSGVLVRKFPRLMRIMVFIEVLWDEAVACMRVPSIIFVGLPLALSVHVLNFSLIFLLSYALHLPFGYFQILSLMPVLFLVLMAPVTISGHGLREIFLIAYCGWLARSGQVNLTKEHAVVFSVALVSADLVSSGPGGLWYLLHRRRGDTSHPSN